MFKLGATSPILGPLDIKMCIVDFVIYTLSIL